MLVIVSKEVEEAVQGKNPELGALGVARRAGLAPGDASRDDDVSEEGDWGLGVRRSGFGIGETKRGRIPFSIGVC